MCYRTGKRVAASVLIGVLPMMARGTGEEERASATSMLLEGCVLGSCDFDFQRGGREIREV